MVIPEIEGICFLSLVKFGRQAVSKTIPNFAARLSIAIDKQMNVFEENNGTSIDAYSDELCYHPMAEAKYLASLSALFSANMMSEPLFDKKVKQSIDRLNEHSVMLEGGFIAWGLGFQFRDYPVDEPFLITTAIIASAMVSVVDVGGEKSIATKQLERVVKTLLFWLEEKKTDTGDGIRIPEYSPGISEPIFNSAAYAIAAVREASRLMKVSISDRAISDHDSCMKWINGYYLARLGWPYSPNNPRVDLLHQAYILNSYATMDGVPSIEQKSIDLIGQFNSSIGYIDSGISHSETNGLFDKNIPVLRMVGDTYFEVVPKPARLWSLGELLVLVARLAEGGEHKQAWLAYGRKLSAFIMEILDSGHPETNFLRHTMHALHGLSAHLSVMRKKSGTEPR